MLRGLHRRPAKKIAHHNVAGAVLACAVAGMLFGPAFGSALASAVFVPVFGVALAVYAGYAASRRWRLLRPMRAVLGLLLGALVIAETALSDTTAGLIPTGSTWHGMYDGVRHSWLLVLQSTTPVRAEPELLTFVPELVLLASLLAVEILMRTGARLAALIPSLAVAALAEAFRPLGTFGSIVAVLAYAGAVGLALGARPGRPHMQAAGTAAAVTVVGALVFGVLDPFSQPAFSLRDHVPSIPPPGGGPTPLDDLAFRLNHGHTPAFSVRDAAGVDRWTLADLNRFDGTSWTSDGHLRYLGAGVASSRVTGVPTRQLHTTVLNDELVGPWLPSQSGLHWVSPLKAVVDESTGMLLAHGVHPNSQYELRFSAPIVTPGELAGAKLDLDAIGKTIFDTAVPADITTIARVAGGRGRPSFAMALRLERYLAEHYHLAVAPNVPAGSAWLDLVHFLDPGSAGDLESDGAASPGSGRRGTSEQFATAYVAMAHVLGIPARLAVGFRQPQKPLPDGSYVVRNEDALAWPEVAVQGIGWVPLDPQGQPGKGEDNPRSALAQSLAELRANTTPTGKLPTATHIPTVSVDISIGSSTAQWLHGIVVLLLVLGAFALVSVPGLKYVRGAMRRRRVGSAAIVSAWRETCDRLVDHGVEVRRSMTVHEVAGSVATVDWQLVRAVGHLGDLVDDALWSGDGARPATVQAAWKAVDAIRDGLARRPIGERLAALLTVRSLLAVR